MNNFRPVYVLPIRARLCGLAVWVLLAAIVMLCAGCAEGPPPVQVVPSVERVLVPVPCIPDASKLPPEPPRVASLLNGMAAHDLLVVAPSALDLRSWGEKLNAALIACAAASPPAPSTGPTP